ncbi:MAG TPA: hypothetical protein VI981_01925 [Candidatus Paceibacterota bacterium]
MKTLRQNFFSAVRITVIALVLTLGANLIYSWNAPTTTPPTGNVAMPINVSSAPQGKLGTFGLGLASPDTSNSIKLDVLGKIKIVDGSQGADKVLKSDANGVATWQALSNISGGGNTCVTIDTANGDSQGRGTINMVINGRNICADNIGCSIHVWAYNLTSNSGADVPGFNYYGSSPQYFKQSEENNRWLYTDNSGGNTNIQGRNGDTGSSADVKILQFDTRESGNRFQLWDDPDSGWSPTVTEAVPASYLTYDDDADDGDNYILNICDY